MVSAIHPKPTRVTVSPDGAAYEVTARDGLLGVHFIDADGDHAVIHFEPGQGARFRDDVARELARLNGESPITAMVLRTLRNTFALVATMEPREAAKIVAEVEQIVVRLGGVLTTVRARLAKWEWRELLADATYGTSEELALRDVVAMVDALDALLGEVRHG